jgi:hypothetical protein
MVVAVVNAEAAAPWSVQSVTATGLTFSPRGSVHGTAGHGYNGTEIWWAVAGGGGFTGTITANLDSTIDDANIHVFSVTGANTSSPWDAPSSTTALGDATAKKLTTTGTLTIANVGDAIVCWVLASPYTEVVSSVTDSNSWVAWDSRSRSARTPV